MREVDVQLRRAEPDKPVRKQDRPPQIRPRVIRRNGDRTQRVEIAPRPSQQKRRVRRAQRQPRIQLRRDRQVLDTRRQALRGFLAHDLVGATQGDHLQLRPLRSSSSSSCSTNVSDSRGKPFTTTARSTLFFMDSDLLRLEVPRGFLLS
jgi:hypothetical protein